ncbi:MAG: N-acetylneuraminate synthase [Candidatus Nitrohelix vancouverensis]|uniref:N-acetylneuraminate synthase n=1 Tax=Candidatus Nitrohelix vancouverensis TaxID=2705534 RepID=A0A7T0G294_9BACT|nr:MAG: N-acetylneuraminate synthase [Candidatus Nitrohelix vancouverensis]
MKSTYIIAEAGVNHNGERDLAFALVDAAAKAGADAVKFQTFRAHEIVSRHSPKASYQIKETGSEETQLEMLQRLELSPEMHRELAKRCQKQNIQFLSTPFDLESLRFLAEDLKTPRIKLPSGEITNAPLLLGAARTGKAAILSTGMATLGEIEMALGTLAFGYLNTAETPSREAFEGAIWADEGQRLLREKVTLLHCTTEYPAPVESVNLRAMQTMKQAFGLDVGYSDHTAGIAVATAAVALGATLIEKHFTLDCSLPGPDHRASLEPETFKSMASSIRDVEAALGEGRKLPVFAERENRKIVRRSLIASRRIDCGDAFDETNIAIKRPGGGVSPMRYWDVLGRKSNRVYEAGELIEL